MIMKKKVENWPAPCQALLWSRCLSSGNFNSCGAGNKQISSCNCQIGRNSIKKKRAGIELESLGVTVGVCMFFFFFRWGEMFWWLRQGDTWGDCGRRGKNVPGKGRSMKELETARRPGGKEWMSEGKMVRDEAGDGTGTRSHRPYTLCLGGWVLLWENLEALCRAVAELVCLWSGSSQPLFGGWAAGAGVELGAQRGGCCQVLSGRWWCGWERGKAPVCSEDGAHRLCREMEGRVRKKEESGKPRSSPGTGFHLWRQGRLWGEPSWEPFLEWGLLSTSSRSFLADARISI